MLAEATILPMDHSQRYEAYVVRKQGMLTISQLRADCPVHLSTNYNLQRDMNPENQFTGVFVAPNGTIKDDTHGKVVCRFSFRRHGEEGAWKPQLPGQVIKSGESVNLYCHSVGLGPFSDINSPPAEAAPVYVTSTGKLLVPISSFTDPTRVRELIQDYELGKLSDNDTAAFEKMGFISDTSWLPSKFAVPPLSEVSWSTSTSRATTFCARFGSTFKKSSRVDYKKLQMPEWKDRDLDWPGVRQRYYHAGVSQNIKDSLSGLKPAEFTILFE